MTASLANKTVAFLTANSGVEQVELTEPWKAVEAAGGRPVLLAPEAGEVKAFNNDVEPGDSFTAEVAVGDADPAGYDGLVLPGGTTSPDALRIDGPAMQFVRDVAAAGKPVAAICHGPWSLVETGLVSGRTVTSWPSLRTDIENAGGTWTDQEVVIDTDGGFPLVTSRKPDDLQAFCDSAVAQFAGAGR